MTKIKVNQKQLETVKIRKERRKEGKKKKKNKRNIKKEITKGEKHRIQKNSTAHYPQWDL